MINQILDLCAQIESAANAIYIRGCDDVAVSNMAQLRGICLAVGQIRKLVKENGEKEGKNA